MAKSDPYPSMRLLTYNIHKGIGGRDRRYRFDRIIQVIEKENPDIICLQEVDRHEKRSHFHDQPRMLAENFNASCSLFQLNVPKTSGGYGNLLLSRWPFHCRHQISLSFANKKPRGAQLAVVETPEGLLHLVNFHLGLAGKERHWQIKHLLGHPLFRESAHLPTLITGDFNDWRNKLGKAHFADQQFEQATAPPSRFRSFPAFFPVASLDKAFFRGDLFVRQVRVVRSRLAKRASDHLPVVIDFHLRTL
ncbi:MAG TPA: endonuclease/exonuclease/phosphatase family protein [Gemmataceae bacterium]|nr:endonuclease/exonuclease/phosphatase family protein [Gemmataceae bacterium]